MMQLVSVLETLNKVGYGVAVLYPKTFRREDTLGDVQKAAEKFENIRFYAEPPTNDPTGTYFRLMMQERPPALHFFVADYWFTPPPHILDRTINLRFV